MDITISLKKDENITLKVTKEGYRVDLLKLDTSMISNGLIPNSEYVDLPQDYMTQDDDLDQSSDVDKD